MEAVRESSAEKTPDPDLHSLSDEDLIDLICAGTRAATEALLIDRYGRLLHYFARRYSDDDLVADIYLHLCSNGSWERLRKWEGRSKFSSWLGAVAWRLHADKRKLLGRETVNLQKYASQVCRLREEGRVQGDQPSVSITRREENSTRLSRILRALDTLSARDRLLLSLLDLRDPPEKIEIVAEKMKLKVEAVRVAHTRAKSVFERRSNGMGASSMNEYRGNHPSIAALAEFAEGRSRNPAAIAAHLDACEPCALEVLAAREAIAFESLGADEFPMPRDFEIRARRELLAVIGSKGQHSKPASHFGALGAFGLLGGLGGLGSVTAGPELVLAETDHPDEIPPHSEKNLYQGEIPGHDDPSHSSEDDISRMLDHLHDVLGDDASDHPLDLTGHTSFADDFSAHTDSSTMLGVEIPPVDHNDSLDPGSSDAADHHHDNPLDHGDDDDFHG